MILLLNYDPKFCVISLSTNSPEMESAAKNTIKAMSHGKKRLVSSVSNDISERCSIGEPDY